MIIFFIKLAGSALARVGARTGRRTQAALSLARPLEVRQ